jgi:hypothetical protein
LGSLREMTAPGIPMRGHHERRRQPSPPSNPRLDVTDTDAPRSGVRTSPNIFSNKRPSACPVTGRAQQPTPARPYGSQHLRDGPNAGNQMSTDNQGAQWPTSRTSPN